MAGAISTSDPGTWPPSRLITVTGLANVTVTVNRIIGGIGTPVRGADGITVWPSTGFAIVDAELPFGVPVTYQLVEAGVAGASTSPETVTLTGGKVALSDAITGLSAEVEIGAIDDLDRTAEASTYAIDGRLYVVSAPLADPQTTVEYLTTTITARDTLRALLQQCTTGVFQQRAPSQDYDGDAYYSIVGVSERRFSQDGTDQRRITAVRVAQSLPWPGALEARGHTYADWASVYGSSTYAAVDALYGDYLDAETDDIT